VCCASETCEKYEVASGPFPVEHFQFYIWLNGDELGFERSLARRRATALGKSCAGYQGKDSHPDLLTHLHPLHLVGRSLFPFEFLQIPAWPHLFFISFLLSTADNSSTKSINT